MIHILIGSLLASESQRIVEHSTGLRCRKVYIALKINHRQGWQAWYIFRCSIRMPLPIRGCNRGDVLSWPSWYTRQVRRQQGGHLFTPTEVLISRLADAFKISTSEQQTNVGVPGWPRWSVASVVFSDV